MDCHQLLILWVCLIHNVILWLHKPHACMYMHILLCVETTNNFFHTIFDPTSNSFACQFVHYYGNKSCSIMYGPKQPMIQNCYPENKAESSSSNHDTVIVPIPQLLQTDSEFCFIARGTTPTLTIVVEGTFNTGIPIIYACMHIEHIICYALQLFQLQTQMF